MLFRITLYIQTVKALNICLQISHVAFAFGTTVYRLYLVKTLQNTIKLVKILLHSQKCDLWRNSLYVVWNEMFIHQGKASLAIWTISPNFHTESIAKIVNYSVYSYSKQSLWSNLSQIGRSTLPSSTHMVTLHWSIPFSPYYPSRTIVVQHWSCNNTQSAFID